MEPRAFFKCPKCNSNIVYYISVWAFHGLTSCLVGGDCSAGRVCSEKWLIWLVKAERVLKDCSRPKFRVRVNTNATKRRPGIREAF